MQLIQRKNDIVILSTQNAQVRRIRPNSSHPRGLNPAQMGIPLATTKVKHGLSTRLASRWKQISGGGESDDAPTREVSEPRIRVPPRRVKTDFRLVIFH
jgi:hypothetical protein